MTATALRKPWGFHTRGRERPEPKLQVAHMIVKVQVPLATNDPDALALVYAKGHIGMTQQALSPGTLRQMKGDAKAFFEGHHNGKRWVIGARVKDQDW